MLPRNHGRRRHIGGRLPGTHVPTTDRPRRCSPSQGRSPLDESAQRGEQVVRPSSPSLRTPFGRLPQPGRERTHRSCMPEGPAQPDRPVTKLLFVLRFALSIFDQLHPVLWRVANDLPKQEPARREALHARIINRKPPAQQVMALQPKVLRQDLASRAEPRGNHPAFRGRCLIERLDEAKAARIVEGILRRCSPVLPPLAVNEISELIGRNTVSALENQVSIALLRTTLLSLGVPHKTPVAAQQPGEKRVGPLLDRGQPGGLPPVCLQAKSHGVLDQMAELQGSEAGEAKERCGISSQIHSSDQAGALREISAYQLREAKPLMPCAAELERQEPANTRTVVQHGHISPAERLLVEQLPPCRKLAPPQGRRPHHLGSQLILPQLTAPCTVVGIASTKLVLLSLPAVQVTPNVLPLSFI